MFLELEDSTKGDYKYYLQFETDSDNLKAGVLSTKEDSAQSKDKKNILCTDDILRAISCAYKAKYDGFLFTDADAVKDIAQIFRTYSLPCLLIVEVKGSELDDVTQEKILNALKAGVDYVAINGDLMDTLEGNKMKDDEHKEDSESDDGNESAD